MKELHFLHYKPGKSLWQSHDIRIKLLELLAWTIAVMMGRPLLIGVTALEITILYAISGVRMRHMLRPLAFWAFMALAIVAASGFSDRLNPIQLFGRKLPFGLSGLYDGVLRSLRLLVVLLGSHLFASASGPSDLAFAIRKITFFLPASWSASIAASISLTFAMLPRILDASVTVHEAARSRALGSRPFILFRVVKLALPIAAGALRQAELCAEAMISRGMDENPTPKEYRLHFWDLAAAAGLLLPLFFLSIRSAPRLP